MNNDKIQIGIFFGGVSPEHDVSIKSAKGIIENIDRDLFDVIEIYIERDGEFDLSKMDEIDIAFPILHGAGGEDGTIQGFFETLGLAYVGNGVNSSALCLDKAFCNDIMEQHNIKQAKFAVVDNIYNDKKTNDGIIKSIKSEFTFPVFVKSARTGSSVGVYKVKAVDELEPAIEKALEFDTKIVIEESIENASEIEIAVLGNTTDDIETSLPGKLIPGAEFYDYDDKYNNDKAEFEIPAKLPADKIKEIQELARQVYKIANCRGLARVDFLMNDDGIFLNEVNTMPGFTPISMYPKLWEASGLSYRDLITKLIKLA